MAAFDPKRHVGIHPERVSHVSSTDYPGHHPAQDNAWNLAKFQQKLTVRVERLSNRSIDFDLVGVDASIANAFRRILIAENACIYGATLPSSPTKSSLTAWDSSPSTSTPPFWNSKTHKTIKRQTETRSCSGSKPPANAEKNAPKDATDPEELFINSEILSSQFEWVPQGEQGTVMSANPPTPTNPNIVLAKLRPGQEVDMELHAVKGVGKDHAKFCPVATASYRLLPEIILNPAKPVPSNLAEKFQKCFSPGVIRVHPRTKKVSVDEKSARFESMSREVYRHPEFDGCAQLARVRDHFLFCIESEGFYPPERLLPEAIQVMRTKIATLRRAAEALLNDTGTSEDAEMAEA
ncbi:DNA-directed RNA polymerase [Lanmaoa asiatica]|nr:DNA-directed RNA polymerase [Lanmaoa asiatica]